MDGSKKGFFSVFEDDQLGLLCTSMEAIAGGSQPIALCEAAMLPHAALAWADTLRGRSVIWYCDNTNAMHAFVKGASCNATLERLVFIFWVLMFNLDCQVWIEWVDSDSNWSDGISREFDADEWIKKHNFPAVPVELDMEWWLCDYTDVWRAARALVGMSSLSFL